MPELFDKEAETLGPKVLGHDGPVLSEQRQKILDAVESTGAISFRDDPLLPWLKNPKK